MLVIGLTGGIGAGKTTAANLFAKRGVPIIDADVIAKKLTMPGQPLHDEIVAHFKEKITSKDGTLNRAKLRQLIFADHEAKKWLEELLHPVIKNELEAAIAQLHSPYCILVIPLLVEVGSYPYIDRILVVDAAAQAQIKRVQQRDNATSDEVTAIIEKQIHRNTRLAKAHDIIHNDGTIADLDKQIDNLHNIYSHMHLGLK